MGINEMPGSGFETSVLPPVVAAGVCRTEIRIKGRNVAVPSVQVNGRTVIQTGKWLSIANIKDEELTEGNLISDPTLFLRQLNKTGLRPDLFTFAQKLPDSTARHPYHVEWENYAVIPVSTFSEWWEKRVEASVRRAVRKAAKSGIEVRVAELNDAFVNGIVGINNETPVRQGKRFWHYQKSYAAVKEENSTYADRNTFLGAYCEGELIGFIRLTCVDGVAHILQLLSMVKHFDKRPANAMIAKAVEVCAERGMSLLTYRNYVYNGRENSLTEFKRRSGFEKMLVPRYYVPLTIKGTSALKLGLHRGLVQQIPTPLLAVLLKMRADWNARRSGSGEQGL